MDPGTLIWSEGLRQHNILLQLSILICVGWPVIHHLCSTAMPVNLFITSRKLFYCILEKNTLLDTLYSCLLFLIFT